MGAFSSEFSLLEILQIYVLRRASQEELVVKNLPANAGD